MTKEAYEKAIEVLAEKLGFVEYQLEIANKKIRELAEENERLRNEK